MKNFKSISSYTHPRGYKVFQVENDTTRNIDNGLRNFNDFYPCVKIDGIIYDTIRIEAGSDPELITGDIIGISIKNKLEQKKRLDRLMKIW